MQLNEITIPLCDLKPSPKNVRKTYSPEGIKELADSIRAHGLMHPLVVDPDNRVEVIAGERRLNALLLLAANDALPADHPIRCTIGKEGVDATEISLAENVVREEMSPADQAVAFKRLSEKMDTETLADHFGVSEIIVRKRLRLAEVSPVVLQALRDEKISLSQAQAFTVTEDHELQEKILEDRCAEDSPAWRSEPDDLREALTPDDAIKGDDARAVFVGVPAYIDAGGTYTADLFTEGYEGYILQDEELLDNLVNQRLEAIAGEVRAEGWKEVLPRATFSHRDKEKYKSIPPHKIPLPVDQQKTVDDLEEKINKCGTRIAEIEDMDTDALTDAQASELEVEMDGLHEEAGQFQETIDKIGQEYGFAWHDEEKAASIAVVTLDLKGNPKIHRGIVAKDDPAALKEARAASKSTGGDGPKTKTEKEKPADILAITAKLQESLTAHMTAAIAAEMIENPRLALAASVFELASNILLEKGGGPCGIKATKTRYPDHFDIEGTCLGYDAMMLEKKKCQEKIAHAGKDMNKLWEHISTLPLEDLLSLHAYCAAATVDIIDWNNGMSSGGSTAKDGHRLARSLGTDMTKWFKTKTANYFADLGKLQILVALKEALGKKPLKEWEKLSKKDLSELAEREVSFTNPNYLPPQLRIPEPKTPRKSKEAS